MFVNKVLKCGKSTRDHENWHMNSAEKELEGGEEGVKEEGKEGGVLGMRSNSSVISLGCLFVIIGQPASQ